MDGEPGAPVNEQSEEKLREVQPEEKIIFWARASKCSIAGWVQEVISGGKITVPDQSLRFSNHIRVASSHKKNRDGISEIDFIKNSYAYESGTDIVMCKDMDEARALTVKQRLAKGTRPDEVEDVINVSRT